MKNSIFSITIITLLFVANGCTPDSEKNEFRWTNCDFYLSSSQGDDLLRPEVVNSDSIQILYELADGCVGTREELKLNRNIGEMPSFSIRKKKNGRYLLSVELGMGYYHWHNGAFKFDNREFFMDWEHRTAYIKWNQNDIDTVVVYWETKRRALIDVVVYNGKGYKSGHNAPPTIFK